MPNDEYSQDPEDVRPEEGVQLSREELLGKFAFPPGGGPGVDDATWETLLRLPTDKLGEIASDKDWSSSKIKAVQALDGPVPDPSPYVLPSGETNCTPDSSRVLSPAVTSSENARDKPGCELSELSREQLLDQISPKFFEGLGEYAKWLTQDDLAEIVRSERHVPRPTPPSLDSEDTKARRDCRRSRQPRFMHDFSTGELAPYRCKMWDCVYCGPRKRRRFIKQLFAWGVDKDLSRHVTLTLDPKTLPAWCETDDNEAVWEYLQIVWRRFMARYKRRYKDKGGKKLGDITYVQVREVGKRDRHVHIHMLSDRFTPKWWYSKAWSESGGGQVTWVSQVDAQHISTYLTKYVSKDLCESAPSRKRRFTTSQDIHVWENPGEVPRTSSEGCWRLYIDRGFKISKKENAFWTKLGLRAPPGVERFGALGLSPVEIMASIQLGFD